MSQEVAIFGGLFNAFLWGSWAVVLKKLDGYPLDAFFMALYIFSFVFVWGIGLLALGERLFDELAAVWRGRPAVILVALIAGGTFVIGVRITLTVFTAVGLSVTAPIQTFMSLILGTSLAALVGGAPAAIAPVDLMAACLLFFAAAMATARARILRDRSLFEGAANQLRDRAGATSRRLIAKNMLLVAIASAIITAYPLGLSYSLKSTSRDFGLTPLAYILVLATGSLCGALLSSGAVLTHRRQWSLMLRAGWKLQRYSLIAALAHYGGNLINAYATGALTAAVSWPLGTSSQLWTYVWGVATGEFKGAPPPFVSVDRSRRRALFWRYLVFALGANPPGLVEPGKREEGMRKRFATETQK